MSEDPQKPSSFNRVAALVEAWLRPEGGDMIELADAAISPDGTLIAGAGILPRKIGAPLTQRLCLIDRASGDVVLAPQSDGGVDRRPAWSPDGAWIAYLAVRGASPLPEVWVREVSTGQERHVVVPENWAEYLQWSPDGDSLLIGAAGLNADVAGIAGATTTKIADAAKEPWAPEVSSGVRAAQWRSIWTLDMSSWNVKKRSPCGVNIWEAAWRGSDAIVCIASDAPTEDDWYTADVRVLDLASGQMRRIYAAEHQIAWLSAAPNGNRVCLAAGLASDRGILAGELFVGACEGDFRVHDTLKVDVTQTAWIDDDTIVFCGLRGLETVVGRLDCRTGESEELWRSETLTFGGPGAFVPAMSVTQAQLAFIAEGHFEPPQITTVDASTCETGRSRSFGARFSDGKVRRYGWRAPDGLEIEGFLLTPDSEPPYPLVLQVHGGPVFAYRPAFLGRGTTSAALLRAGYALLQPNPRGSLGRGIDFVRHVYGDMGGKDVGDLLSGIDALVADGIADPQRLGVTGISYGGYIAAWIITQDDRFAASVPICPVTNWVSERLTSNVPTFADQFLGGDYDDLSSHYFDRSPVLFARNVKTPTLNVAGALDNITPPTQAVEFHNALLSSGVESTLVIYPQEGHAIRQYPALIDCTARMLDWFRHFMPAR